MIYGNAEDFKKYLRERGKEVSEDWSDEKINSALLVASEWLDSQFETMWIGYKSDGFTQERSWPRKAAAVCYFPYHLYDDMEIPGQVIKATYEAAFRELGTNGILQKDFQPSQYRSVSVEGAVAVEYNDLVLSAPDAQIQIPIIQKLMESLIDPNKSGVNSSLSGVAVRV